MVKVLQKLVSGFEVAVTLNSHTAVSFIRSTYPLKQVCDSDRRPRTLSPPRPNLPPALERPAAWCLHGLVGPYHCDLRENQRDREVILNCFIQAQKITVHVNALQDKIMSLVIKMFFLARYT